MSTLTNGTTAAPTTERAREYAHNAIDQAATKAGQVEQDVRRSAERASTKLSESKSTVDDSLQDAVNRVSTFAKERPAAAAGLAFAAGVLATTLLRK